MKAIMRNFLFTLRRFKLSSFLNIMGLSIAFTTFIVIVMQIKYDQSYDRSYKDSDRIYRVDLKFGDNSQQAILNRPLADVLFESSPHIESYSLFEPPIEYNEYMVNTPQRGGKFGFLEFIAKVYPSFPEMFGLEMLEGDINALSDPGKVIISESLSQKLFEKENALNEPIIVGKAHYTVGGVYKDLPVNSSVRSEIYGAIGEENINQWGNFWYFAYVKIDNASSIPLIMQSFISKLPEKAQEPYIKDGRTMQFTLLNQLHYQKDIRFDHTPKSTKENVAMFWTIAFAVLIIAAINFVNFSIAMSPKRIKMLNTQMIVGAHKSQIRIFLVVEALFISLIAFIVSLGIIWLLSYSSLVDLIEGGIHFSSSENIIALAAVLAVLTGLLSGIYPSYYITSFTPALALKGGIASTPRGKALRNLLIGIQFTASFVFIIFVFIMYQQYHYMRNVSVGYDKDQLIITDIDNEIGRNRKTFSNELKAFPGIKEITYSESLFGGQDIHMSWGREYKDGYINFNVLPVDPLFLKVMNISVTEGRDFLEDEEFKSTGKYIFNEKAKNEFGLELNSFIQGNEIIGFMPDIQYRTLYSSSDPMAFFVWGTNNWGERNRYAYIKLEAGTDAYAAREYIVETLTKLNPEYPYNVRFYDDAWEHAYQKDKRITKMVTIFSIITIFISIIGVFGLVLFETEYRRKEISIRKVVGSSVTEILNLFMKNYLIILVLCFVIACPIVYFVVTKWLENFVFKTPLSIWIFMGGGLIVFLVTLLTILMQSYNAASENPADVLKSE